MRPFDADAAVARLATLERASSADHDSALERGFHDMQEPPRADNEAYRTLRLPSQGERDAGGLCPCGAGERCRLGTVEAAQRHRHGDTDQDQADGGVDLLKGTFKWVRARRIRLPGRGAIHSTKRMGRMTANRRSPSAGRSTTAQYLLNIGSTSGRGGRHHGSPLGLRRAH